MEKKKKKASNKFLGVMLDENISWEEHIRSVETKLAKNIGLLYSAKPLFILHTFIHT